MATFSTRATWQERAERCEGRHLIVCVGSFAASVADTLRGLLSRHRTDHIALLQLRDRGQQDIFELYDPGSDHVRSVARQAEPGEVDEWALRSYVRGALRARHEPPATGPDVHLYVEVVVDLRAEGAERLARAVSAAVRAETGRCDLTLYLYSGRSAQASPEEHHPRDVLASAARFLMNEPAYHRVYVIDPQDSRRLWHEPEQAVARTLAHVLLCRTAALLATASRTGEQASLTVLDPPEAAVGTIGWQCVTTGRARLVGALADSVLRRLAGPSSGIEHLVGEEAAGAAHAMAEWIRDRLAQATSAARCDPQDVLRPQEVSTQLRATLRSLWNGTERGWAGLGHRVRAFCRVLERELAELVPTVVVSAWERNRRQAWYEIRHRRYQDQLRRYRRQQAEADLPATTQKRVGVEPYEPRRRALAVAAMVAAGVLMPLGPAVVLLAPNLLPAWVPWLVATLAGIALAIALKWAGAGRRMRVIHPQPGRRYGYLLRPARWRSWAALGLCALGAVALGAGWRYVADPVVTAMLVPVPGPLPWVVFVPLRPQSAWGLGLLLGGVCAVPVVLRVLLEGREAEAEGAVPLPGAATVWWGWPVWVVDSVAVLGLVVGSVQVWRDGLLVQLLAEGGAGWWSAAAAGGIGALVGSLLLASYRRVGEVRTPGPAPVEPPRPRPGPPPVVVRLARWCRMLQAEPAELVEGVEEPRSVLDLVSTRWRDLLAERCLDEAERQRGAVDWVGWLVARLESGAGGPEVVERVLAERLVADWVERWGWEAVVGMVFAYGRPLRELFDAVVPLQWPPGFERPVRDTVLLVDEQRFAVLELTVDSGEAERTLREFVARSSQNQSQLHLVRLRQGMSLPRRAWLDRGSQMQRS